MNNLEKFNKPIKNSKDLESLRMNGFYAVLNPAYENKSMSNLLIDALKNHPLESIFKDEVFKTHFFKKEKSPERVKSLTDYSKGKSTYNPIDPMFQDDFNKDAIYNKGYTRNEISLSKKVKEIISSKEVQKIAQESGYFAGMTFCEPILSIVSFDGTKYLIYERIITDSSSSKSVEILSDVQIKKLRAIFLRNEIFPHDLRREQFLITRREGRPYLVLIDTEAYRDMTTVK